jgi:hypothetical protein
MAGIGAGGEREELLGQLGALLDQARVQRRTMTYLDVADALAIEGPHRIHKITRLVEILLKRDSENGQPIRSALVVSRTRAGRPAPGFFDRAARLGLHDGSDPDGYHDRLLAELFNSG